MTALVLRQLSDSSRLLVWLALAVMVASAWMALVFLVHGAVPGLYRLICGRDGAGVAAMPALLAMWLAMAFAMMLPSAAPMIATYLDIAEAARAKRMAVVSPVVLAGGYMAVWIAFAAAAAALQAALRWSEVDLAAPPVAAVLLIGAGTYQFSTFKHACLSKCRRPMPFFMANWTVRRSGVFRMGVRQGALCLGCCWALMLLALAAGFMNVAWMAAIGALMVLEKSLPAPKFITQGLGIGLIAAGAAVLVAHNGG
ncbi:MAG TPA: DUF2182 domain-containing protein [Aestuariivirga sp.]|nr:DUF2182 domain-containing protein [Aestuariivirga sp.]